MDSLAPEVKEAVESALRELQRFDEVLPASAARPLLLSAQSHLGGLLGLECTGVLEAGGFYDHDGDTCPIHEWLYPDDQPEIEARFAAGNRPPRVG